MKFSMNGFRRSLSAEVDRLRQEVERVVMGAGYDEEELAEAMNAVVTASNVINCVYQDGDDNFSDISDLEIPHIET